MSLTRLLRSRQAGLQAMQSTMRASPYHSGKQFEEPNISDASRHEDEPEPTEDDMIKTHYLKHHPLYEFRNFEEHHVDNYRHWLHGRADYFNTETYPSAVSPWEMGSKFNHAFYLAMPFLSFVFIGFSYKKHLSYNKNVKMPIVGVFSQISC